jgi:hypothetical protein
MKAQTNIALIGIALLALYTTGHYTGWMTQNTDISHFASVNNIVGATLMLMLYTATAYKHMFTVLFATIGGDLLYTFKDIDKLEPNVALLMHAGSYIVLISLIFAIHALVFRASKVVPTGLNQ